MGQAMSKNNVSEAEIDKIIVQEKDDDSKDDSKDPKRCRKTSYEEGKNSNIKDGGSNFEDKDSKDNENNLTDKNEDSGIKDGGLNFEDKDSKDNEKNLKNKNEDSEIKDKSLKDEKEVIDTVNDNAETAEDKLNDFEGNTGKKELEELNADLKAVKVLEDAVEALHEMMKLMSNKVTSSGNVLNRILKKGGGLEDKDSKDNEKSLKNKNEDSEIKDKSLKDEKEVIDTVNDNAETAEVKLNDFEGNTGKKELEEVNADLKAAKVLEDAVGEDLHEMMKLTLNEVTSSGKFLNRILEKVGSAKERKRPVRPKMQMEDDVQNTKAVKKFGARLQRRVERVFTNLERVFTNFAAEP